MRSLVVAGTACALLIAAQAHAAGSAGAHTPSCAGSAPKAVVHAYYAAINLRRAKNAKACLTPYFRAQSAQAGYPDWVNIVWVRKLHLESRSVPDSYLPGNVPHKDTKPLATAEVTAQFTVRYHRVMDSPNGVAIRFIYAVRQTKHAPWRIASIGSGP